VKKITDNIGGVQQFATRLLENGSESEIMALKKLIFTQMLELFSKIPDVKVDAKLLYTPDVNGFENHCRVSCCKLFFIVLSIINYYYFLHRNILVRS
jgi:hypothetical protein